MRTVKIFLFLSIFTASIYAQTPFVLSGVKSYYPVVEINTDKIDTKYKQIILDMIVAKSTELGIETKNFSSRSLAFLISYIGVGDTLAIKMDLLLGENVIRLDTKEEIFVVSYMSGRIFVPQEIEDDLLDNAEELLEMFGAQYIEDHL
ncbi:MAG: hypothetical protein WC390_07700 [Sulfurimonas sp.]|jgi:hypothetical protein